ASGERKWVLEIAQGIFNEEDCLNSIEGILLDITDRKEMENHLRYISEHDNWTGLHNRNYFVNLLKKDLRDGFQGKRAIVGLNLSGLPSLATIYGFQYTQDLKVSLTEGLKSFCSDNIELFYTYDNRFLFYLKDYKNKYEIDLFCDELIHKLSELLERRVTGGIGAIELNKYLDMNVDQILRNLLIASERAIEQYDREFKVCYYDKRMGLEIIREEIIKNELSRVVTDPNDGGLFLEYQPILDLRTNKIAGFEALARLNSDKLGRLAPLEFIPISEKTKLIDPVGKKIMKKALCFLKELEKRGYSEIFVSINISPIQMLRSDFIKSVVDMINNLKINPKNVAFEITETMFASNYLEINSILGKLMDFGITISIDDFGTGYSSFARERELNVNCVKIDKQFIDRLMVLDPEDAITGDIISMAHKLRHKVIAEGVEYEEQRQYLKEKWL
ncbi:MAG: GGDEF domain-containing protein, partial [Clostridiales bacterium]|nr:GGDEF domain-containing protein [Clostridiales bacterium]